MSNMTVFLDHPYVVLHPSGNRGTSMGRSDAWIGVNEFVCVCGMGGWLGGC